MDKKTHNILVIIPTYNEAENIRRIIPDILRQDGDIHVLVIDDNSPDGTADIVKQAAREDERIQLMSRPSKLGLGTAYVAGFRYALEKGYDLVFEMDADYSHDPAVLPVFIKEAREYDLVIGSRYINGVNVVNWPMSRLLLSWLANLYTRIVTGLPVRDATAGYKCFRRSALEAVDFSRIQSDGYGFQIEMNYRIWKKGMRIREIPIVFIDRRVGVSKMSTGIINEAALLVWKLRFLGMTGRL